MNRRNFIESATLISMGIGLPAFIERRKTHIITFSFDDGFKKSFHSIANIHESHGLKACLNVIAMGHEKGYVKDKFIISSPLGDFDDWNMLKSRGHEIMPHSWDHQKLTDLPVQEAIENIDKCFDYFTYNLDKYKPKEAIYNFAYNASNQALDDHTLIHARALRTGGWLVLKDTKYNPIRNIGKRVRLGCWSFGPELCDDKVEQEVNTFLSGPGGWLILNLHGLDSEGWGPISTGYLDRLLFRLVKIKHLDILPTGVVLN